MRHTDKVDGKTVEFCFGKIDELVSEAQAAIPFDNPTLWDDWIKQCIDDGSIISTIISLEGNPIGHMTWNTQGDKTKELVVISAYVRPCKHDFTEVITAYANVLAKKLGCEYIRLHTIRKGLIKKMTDLGFNVSEIVLRKKIS